MKAIISSQGQEKNTLQSLHDLIYSSDTNGAGEFCQKLKTRDIDVLNSYDDSGMAPLHIAVKNNEAELVGLLLEYGADPNKRDMNGNTPIVRAVEQNNPKIVLLLLEEGADLKKTDSDNQAILKIADDKKSDKCVDILRDYGAFFVVSKKSAIGNSPYSGVDGFIKAISALMLDIADESSAAVSFDSFYGLIQEHTKSLFNNQKINIAGIRAQLNKIFDQILLASTNKTFERIDALKATRHVINVLSKINNLNKDCENSVLIVSKLENLIEDEIVHCRTLQLTRSEKSNVVAGERSVNVVANVLIKDVLGVTKNSELFNIETTSIVSKNVSHDIDLINFVKIMPHYVQNKSEIQKLVALSKSRLEMQSNILGGGAKDLQTSEMLISKILQGPETSVTITDAVTIDKILRVGKDEHVHILSLSLNDYNRIETELKDEALMLGANVYAIEYPKNPKHKFDLVYAGIAAINKLIDDNIHPDKIFIQSDGASYNIVKVVISQFARRGIALSEIIVANSDFDNSEIENSHRSLLIRQQAHKVKKSTKYDGVFEKFFKHYAQVLRNNMTPQLHFSTEILKNYTVMQLTALFIKCNQLFLKGNPKSRNPKLPNDKVDNIVGVLPDEI